jgi:hypothetical protein
MKQMKQTIQSFASLTRLIVGAVAALGACATLAAQGPPQGGRGAQPPRSPKDAAPIDLTGYWVSLVTEDWRWRMVTPLKGDSASIPVNQAAKKVMNDWDPAKDEAAGLQCKSYGAAAIMRVPGRLHITWQDDNTLKVETDAGTQTRLLRFAARTAPADTQPSLQGFSAARWEPGLVPAPGNIPLGFGPRMGTRSRSLEVTTTNLSPGYLRKNGIPYSARTSVSEYFEVFSEPNGDAHLMVMTVVTDPEYLAIPFVTTSDFKKEADGSKWDPTPCSAR